MAIGAQLNIVQKGGHRGQSRRELTLRTRGVTGSGEASHVVIQNLSATGLLLETNTSMSVGESLLVDLPETGQCRAKVEWLSGNLFGCSFHHPLSEAVVSAVLLKSEPRRTRTADDLKPGQAYENLVDLAPRLRDLRIRRGLTLVEFARLMDVSRPTIWAWESGKSRPRSSKMKRILAVLSASDEELYGIEAAAPRDHAIAEVPTEQCSLASAISESKKRVAEIAGTSPEHIKIIIAV